MKIEFENDATFIVVTDDEGKVLIRCNTKYTDLQDDESLDDFVSEHGGELLCFVYLRVCYKCSTE